MTLNGCSTLRRADEARTRRARRVRRTVSGSISAAVLVLLVIGLSVVTSVSPAGAAPGPWTWDKVMAGGTTNGTGNFITATCRPGYRVIAAGHQYREAVSSMQVVGQSYAVQAFAIEDSDRSELDVTAWCARSDQVDVQVVDRTLYTNRPTTNGSGLGLGDFACDGDRTPTLASLTWTTGDALSGVVLQSGPESIGGINEWFVTARAAYTSSVLDVKLLCVANADLPGASWVTQSATAGNSTTQETVTAACPTQQRLITGGEHIDSILGAVSSSLPVDSQTWTTTASVPRHDTLSVSVLCAPAGDPVATFTSVPGQVINTRLARFTFSAVDPSTGYDAHNYCFLNTSGLGPCTDIYYVDNLTEGQNVFSIEAYTNDGRGWATTEKDYYFWVDLTKPTVTLKKPALFTLGTTAPLQATGTDNQAVDHYDYTVVARQATGTGASTAVPVTKFYSSTTGKLSLAVKAGMSYRVTTKAVDWANNVSAAATASTAAPLDNFNLTASSQWTLIKGSVYTNKIVSRTTTKGATLTEPVYATKLGVVATTCPTCGQLGVYAGSTLVKTIDLHASATHYQQVTAVSIGTTPKQTTVTLKVLSTGKLVEVDGLGSVVN